MACQMKDSTFLQRLLGGSIQFPSTSVHHWPDSQLMPVAPTSSGVADK